jgi:thioredoxin-like negative regulator of GroEL
MPTLQDGQNAIAQGNLQGARLIFEAILQENPRSEDAWLGLAEVLTETDDKRICYDNVLKINKNNQQAKEGLRMMEPQADPLVAALAPQPTLAEVEQMEADAEATLISARPQFSELDGDETEGGASLPLLVAVGLGLAVVVFAIGGGLVYFLVSSLVG